MGPVARVSAGRRLPCHCHRVVRPPLAPRLPGRSRAARGPGRGRRGRRVRPGQAAGDRAGPQRIRVGGAVGSVNACRIELAGAVRDRLGRSRAVDRLLGPAGIGPSLERPRVGDASGREWRTYDRKRFLPRRVVPRWQPPAHERWAHPCRRGRRRDRPLHRNRGQRPRRAAVGGIRLRSGRRASGLRPEVEVRERAVLDRLRIVRRGPRGIRSGDGGSELRRPEHPRPAHGRADELDGRSSGTRPPENLALELPAWSPDGTRIAYTRVDEPLDTPRAVGRQRRRHESRQDRARR